MILNIRPCLECTVFFDRSTRIDAGVMRIECPKTLRNLHAVRGEFDKLAARHAYDLLPGADQVAARWFVPRWWHTISYWWLGRAIDREYRRHFGYTIPAFRVRPAADVDLICIEYPPYYTLPCIVQAKVEAYGYMLSSLEQRQGYNTTTAEWV